MRLLTVGSLPPEWGGPARGGAATFHAALLTRLLDAVPNVEVVGVLPPTQPERELPVPVCVRPEEVERGRFYEDVLERLQPDVVLMNHIAHTIGVTHTRLGSPVPALGVIQSWHNITFSDGAERERALEVTQEALAGLAAMVAPSRHTLGEGGHLGLRYPPLVETIHNPVPPHYMTDVNLSERDRRGVVYLGSLIPRKDPGVLLAAASLAAALEVRFVGSGELEEELVAGIESLGLEGRVTLARPPDGERHLEWIREALLGAEAMCLPSSSEGLPLAFVEALACGTPIVGFAPAVREIAAEAGLEVGRPLDVAAPEEVAESLEEVRAAKWDRRRLREAALDAFGLDRAVDRYVGLLGRIAESRS